MKTLVLGALLSSIISHGGVAHHTVKPTATPAACPTVDAVSAQGLNQATSIYPLELVPAWLGVETSASYNTKDNWTFFTIGAENVQNGNDAIKVMEGPLSSLTLASDQPEWDNGIGAYVCAYGDGQGNTLGVAYSPAFYS